MKFLPLYVIFALQGENNIQKKERTMLPQAIIAFAQVPR
jgi:hypothetical protein